MSGLFWTKSNETLNLSETSVGPGGSSAQVKRLLDGPPVLRVIGLLYSTSLVLAGTATLSCGTRSNCYM